MHWVKALYFNKEIRIINNGFLSDPIYLTNGLAQGDGLSLLLFVLVIETLALTIRSNDKIEGYRSGSLHKTLALLADDMILSLKAKQITFNQVLDTLQEFAKISNLKVNSDKSAMFAIGSREKSRHLNIEPFKWSKEDYCQYLGISVPLKGFPHGGVPELSLVHILGILDSVLSLQNTCEHSLLGRVLNIKTFVASKLNYYFSLSFVATITALKKAQSRLNDYVWNYRIHYVNAKLLYEPFDTGGVNMYSLIRHNTTAKLKAINKLVCNTTEYWQVVLQSMFKIPFEIMFSANLKTVHWSKLKISNNTSIPYFW